MSQELMAMEKHPILTLLKADTTTQWFWYFPWAWDLNVFFKACFPSEQIKHILWAYVAYSTG